MEVADENIKLQQPLGPPPVCPDALKQLEQYLLCIEQLPTYNFEKSHKFWHRDPQLSSLTNFPLSPCVTTLKPERNPKTGKLLKFKEVFITEIANENEVKPTLNIGTQEIDFENNLMSCPPGLKCGFDFQISKASHQFPGLPVKKNVVNLTNILQVEDSLGIDLQEKKSDKPPDKDESNKPAPVPKVANIDTVDQEEVIPAESSIPILKISETPNLKVLEKATWAEELDVKPVLDFHERVPKLAYTWDFKLDPFQQLAIVKLEEDSNVFVAAHTSAGKTVVAEYAIALSLQRCTRAIYTSPIKALSNQKYRDFRKSFEITKKMGEVGLITGDIQLNPKAPCLIMTTEILRSMLYNKSEVVQDLEFVIFDEVHYINDPDRGHVWEEVMMLLQSHVKIVMLSATVPNAIEFANWVGQIKKKKVYLICTQNRPVPLHFYLYTGTNEGNTDNLFLIRKAEGSWNYEEYHKASQSRIRLEKPPGGGSGRGGGGRGKGGRNNFGKLSTGVNSPKQEKSMWQSFINSLKKKDKLPVVTFVLSRGRCDETADMLRSCLDLVDNNVSDSIKFFFNKSICHLKEEDRCLPQVAKMGELLAKGIGVHHSGILPILKEIVEMLFQQGKVQLLLATETFAMGVNMPTKTVVFESIRKYDGNDWRNLLPAEFIQMAGRAGRRGIDKTGTVIMMCKNKVPSERELRSMMFDKPSKLESQFKMTYATILKNLLRTSEAINPVERMMSSSFKEFSEQSKNVIYREKLDKVEIAYNKLLEKKEMHAGRQPGFEILEDFFEGALAYLNLKREVQEIQLSNPRVMKELTPGRTIVVAYYQFTTRLGLILATDRNKKAVYVLIMVNKNEVYDIICNHDREICICYDEMFYRMYETCKGQERFLPDGTNYKVIKVEPHNIIDVTNLSENMKINYDDLMNDWRGRQYNKNHKPSEDTFRSLQGLMEKSSYFGLNHIINLYKKMDHITLEFKSKYDRLMELKNMLFINLRTMHNYENLFALVYSYKTLEKKRDFYKRKITEFSMSEDFRCKLEILKELKYVDSSNNVEIKGRGAIRMTTNEVMVTELIFRNILSEYEPAEIAALLSCLVFQAKTNIDTKKRDEQLPVSLVAGMHQIKEIHKELVEIEDKHTRNIIDCDDSIYEFTELNFGLVQVVYEWACDKVFSEIMMLTDVQEGIIVRCIQQLNEVLRYVKEIAQKVGDCSLESKMDNASNAIKRDIVFAASLYLQ